MRSCREGRYPDRCLCFAAEAVLSGRTVQRGRHSAAATAAFARRSSGEPDVEDTPYKRADGQHKGAKEGGKATVRFGPREVIEYSAGRWPECRTSVREPDQALAAGVTDLR